MIGKNDQFLLLTIGDMETYKYNNVYNINYKYACNANKEEHEKNVFTHDTYK